MKKNFVLTYILIFSFFQLISQTTYYVAPSSSGGSDSNAGTLVAPFETLQYAINQLTAGDILNIREGTYRETITIDEGNISGPLITIQNYNNEVVTIDGTTDITGTWNTYDNVSGAYRLSYAGSNDITQLFVDEQPMINARWPNAQFNDDSIFSHSTWAEGDEDNSTDGSLTIDTSVHNPGSIDLNNSIGVLNIGSFKTWTVAMTGHNNVTNVITYNEANVPDNDFKEKHHYYFFEGKLDFLDTNNEWFHDKSNDMLYIFPDDSSDPSSRSIKAKLSDNDYRVTLNGAKYVKLKGINFFATTINITGNSDYNTIEKCNFYFPSVSKRMLGTTNGVGTPNVMEISGNSNNNTIIECLFENSEGEALRIRGTNNTIENNYFHHIDWSASDLQGLMVSIWAGTNATSTTYTKNTIHTTGASATVLPGPSSNFSYNKVTNTGLLQSDGAVFQGTKNFVEGSNVHHNFVYDTEKYAFRYDAPGGNAAEAGGYGIMHHNIADNTNGLMIKGNNQVIAHNTVVNTINNRNDIIILSEDCSNTSTWLYNNIAERIGAHRSATSFSVTANSPMPIAGNVGGSDVGYIEVGDDWRACISTDENYTGTGNGSSQNNIDEISVSRTGISDPASGYSVIGDVSGTSKLLNYNAADGKTEADYMPVSGTSIIDSGISPTNSVSTGTSSSDSLDNLIPHTNVNSVADLGALEYGATAWSAGIDWTPKFHTTIWKKTAATTDWNTASNWSTGYVPTSDVHVIIPTGATRYPEISNTGAASKNITVNTSATLTINKGYDLTVAGNFTNRGTVTLNSDSNEFSSIIVQGTSSGNITYNRYVNSLSGGTGWDLIGSPVNGLQISSFATTNDSPLATGNGSGAGDVGEYAIGIYDPSNNTWTNFTTSNVSTTQFTPGKGYQMATDSGATMAFTGTIDTDATETISVESFTDASGRRWNLISNPYPSFITIGPSTTTNTFLDINENVIDDTYFGVYGYDADNSNGSNYTIYNNTSSAKIAPGQGFFVAARSTTAANITFKEEMQTTSTGDDFISGDNMENTEIELRIYNNNNTIGNTKLFFDEGLTLGLDAGYDAGSFTQNDPLMTRLVENDEGHGMAINAMGLDAMENAVIPLVINQSAGQEFRINLYTATIPDPNVYLEDVEEGTFTNLYEGDFVYTPTSDLSGVGRFFIHMTADTMSNEDVSTSMLNAYKEIDASYITIEGLATQTNETNVSLYNILGKEVLSTTFNNNMNTQTISTVGLSAGIYVIELESGTDRLTKKLIIH